MAKRYTAADVGELEGLDKIVQNPGMYVGDNAEVGLNTLWRELIDNAIDEHLAGHGDKIEVTLAKNGAIKVVDEGRGIPVEWKDSAEMSALELVLTRIHAGGKFKEQAGYQNTRRGLHGAGAKAAVAFAKWFTVEVRRYGLAFRQRYEDKGKPTSPVEICTVERGKRTVIGHITEDTVIKHDKTGALLELKIDGKPVKVTTDPDLGSGTTVEFIPDRELFSSTMEWGETPPWNVAALKEFLWQMACLTPGLKFICTVNGEREVFQSKNGLADYLAKMTDGKPPMHAEPITLSKTIEVELPDGKAHIGLEVAMQYAGDDLPVIHAFANTLYNKDGGTHVKGFRDGLSEVLRALSESKRKKGDFKTDDLFVGLNAVVAATGTQRLQFNSQTKAALTSPEFTKAVKEMTTDALGKFFKKASGQDIGLTIVDAAIAVAHARETVKAARELVVKKSLLDAGNGVALAKLSDVTRRGGQPVVPIEFTALYPCEGDSAAGTLKGARDARFHAVYALRGKVENIYDKTLRDALDFAEFAALVTAIGAGVGPDFDPEAMRYGRVVVTSVDGSEPVWLRDENGQTHFMSIGKFIDQALDEDWPSDKIIRWSVACFSLSQQTTRFAPIKSVIRHYQSEPIYHIKTVYNRSVKVTGSHSVFVYEDHHITLKPASSIKAGDWVVAPSRLPASPSKTFINLALELYKRGKTNGLWVEGDDISKALGRQAAKTASEKNSLAYQLLTDHRIELSANDWRHLKNARVAAGITQAQMAEAIGVKQAITISHYERGINRPTESLFDSYLQVLGVDHQNLSSLTTRPSRLSEYTHGPASNNPWRKLSSYKRLSSFTPDEVQQFGDTTKIVPRAHHGESFPAQLRITPEIAYFLGWYLAEGSLGGHSQVRLSLGRADMVYKTRLEDSFENSFGLKPKWHTDKRYGTLTAYVHSVKARALIQALGLDCRAHEKTIPNSVFDWPSDLQYKFLGGYLCGDGCVTNRGFEFATVSPNLATGLRYLLLQLGILTSRQLTDPRLQKKSIQSRHEAHIVRITGKRSVEIARPIWAEHKWAHRLTTLISNGPRLTKRANSLPISDDLLALRVVSVTEFPVTHQPVYDFSVENDENFICGDGGICCHNTDADTDGAHIRALLTVFFYKFMRPMIDAGRLYIARPPLFRVRTKKDASEVYAYSEAERDVLIKQIGGNDKVDVQRFKGLGEMSTAQMAETVLKLPDDVKNHKGKRHDLELNGLTVDDFTVNEAQVTLDDVKQAEHTLGLLMSKTQTESRRRWLMGLKWHTEAE